LNKIIQRNTEATKKKKKETKKSEKKHRKKNKKNNRHQDDSTGDSSSEMVSHQNELSIEIMEKLNSNDVLIIANTIPNDGMSNFNDSDLVEIDPAEIQSLFQE